MRPPILMWRIACSTASQYASLLIEPTESGIASNEGTGRTCVCGAVPSASAARSRRNTASSYPAAGSDPTSTLRIRRIRCPNLSNAARLPTPSHTISGGRGRRADGSEDARCSARRRKPRYPTTPACSGGIPARSGAVQWRNRLSRATKWVAAIDRKLGSGERDDTVG